MSSRFDELVMSPAREFTWHGAFKDRPAGSASGGEAPPGPHRAESSINGLLDGDAQLDIRGAAWRWIAFAVIVSFVSLPALSQPAGPGSALSFDGTGPYVTIATTGSLSGTFTVELWATANSTDVRALVTSRFLTQEFGSDFQLGSWLPNGGTRIHADLGNGTGWITTFADGDFPYDTGTWHHFALVVTPATYTIYADGIPVGMGAVSENDALLFDATHQLGIGFSAFPNSCWNGLIDEVRIWSTARSGQEIQANMHRSLTGTEPGLMGYWRFDEARGTTISDASGHGFDGTLVNSPTWVASSAPIGSLPEGPRLSIQRTRSNKIVVYWPAPSTSFVLQETSTLSPPAWVDVAEPPIEIGDQKLVIVAPPTGNRFYRLRQ